MHDKAIVMALNELAGKPEGGWPETQQAKHLLYGEIPPLDEREYTIGQLIAHALRVDHTDRYQWRAEHLRVYGFEMYVNGRWDPYAPGETTRSNAFDTREEAEVELPRLAEVLACDVSELRVVEVTFQ